MSCDYYRLPHAGIQTLHPYIPGKPIEELSREQGIKDIIKLASNENPLGCSAKVHKALMHLSPTQIATYPSPINHPLRVKLSEQFDLPGDMFTLSNGSDLLFSLILTVFALHSGKQMLTHTQAFISYTIQAQALGIPIKEVPLQENWEVDIEALIAASQQNTAVIFLANPNNPTGLFIPQENIKHLLNQVPESTIVVIDEAYYEYAYPWGDKSTTDLLKHHPNLIITRSFSKIYGLAGLRLGYAIANPVITELLSRVQPPFAVNQAALEAAHAALDDKEFVMNTLALNQSGMQQIKTGLQNLNLNYLPSHCNFLTFDCKMKALPIYNKLLQEGIIVRPLHPYHLLNHLRVTVGTAAQNEEFLKKLAICLS